MQILYLKNKLQKKGVQKPASEIISMILHGATREPVLTARAHLRQGDVKSYNRIKTELPCVAWAIASDDRNSEELSGLLYVDFDKKDNLDKNLTLAKKTLPEAFHNIVAVYNSVSGEGVAALFRFCGLDAKNYSATHKKLCKRIRDLCGLTADSAASDYKRINFISFDDKIYYDPYAEAEQAVAPEPEPAPQGEGAGADISNEELAEYLRAVASFCKETGISYTGSYAEWLAAMAALVNVFGDTRETRELAHLLSATNPAKYSQKDTDVKISALLKNPLKDYSAGSLIYYARRSNFPGRGAESARHFPALDFFNLPLQAQISRIATENWGDEILYNVTKNVYMRYEAGVWRADEVFSPVQDFSQKMQEKIENARNVVAALTPNPRDRKNMLVEYGVERAWRLINSPQSLQSCVNIIKSLPERRIDNSIFDKNLHLIALQNGVFNLQDKKFLQHDKKYYATKKLAFDYAPKANCDYFIDTLANIFSYDERKISFLKKFLGLCLSGRTDLMQGLVFFYGAGANGKSTLINIFRIFLGEYCVQVPSALFLNSTRDFVNRDYIKATLPGVRLCVCSEIPARADINDAALKELTGGDAITARNVYEKPFSYMPTHKLLLVGNHKPAADAYDEAIWRRIYFLHFDRFFTPAERRPESEILARVKKELPGIFNWALGGFYETLKEGRLLRDEIMEQEIAEYRFENNPLSAFLEEYYIPDPDSRLEFSMVYLRYQGFCEENNISQKYVYNKIKFSKIIAQTVFGDIKLATERVGRERETVIRGLRQI